MARKGLRVCTALVEHLGGLPALAGSAIVGDEQSPDRLLRRGAELGSAAGTAHDRHQTGNGFVIPQRRRAGGIEPAAAAHPAYACAPRPGAAPPRATGRRRSATRCGSARTRMRLISGPRASKRRSSRLSLARPRISDLVSTRTRSIRSRNAQRPAHRLPLTCPKGRTTLRTLAKCGRMCGRCRSSTVRILLSWIHAKPAGV